MTIIDLHLADAGVTETLGAVLAAHLWQRPGGVVFLEGALGAGKTTLARGLLRALGVRGAIKSPTYTLLEPYEVDGRQILHMDLYRLHDPEELIGLGVHDYAPAQSYWLVEWPDRGAGLLPAADLHVTLALDDGARRARLHPSSLGAELYARLKAAGLPAESQASS